MVYYTSDPKEKSLMNIDPIQLINFTTGMNFFLILLTISLFRKHRRNETDKPWVEVEIQEKTS